MNILLVDDDPLQRYMLENMIRDDSIVVHHARNQDEAISVLDLFKIDGCFLDLMLEEGSSMEVARVCQVRGIPVVFATATHDEHNLRLMYGYGWVIAKPLRLQAVERGLEHFKLWSNRRG